MGRVIGMNTAIATGETEPQRQQFAGIGLAIPIDVIDSVVDQVVNDGTIRKGFLGVHVLDQDQPLAFWFAQHNFRGSGVLVSAIDADHPGRQAGLRIGDIITNYDSAPTSDSAALEELVRADVDDTSRLRIWRYQSGGPEWVDVEWRRGGTTTSGLRIHDLRDRISEHHRLLGCPSQGVLVSIVRTNEPAHRAGMRPGDVITTVNTRSVQTVQQLQSRISSIRPGQTAVLDVWRYDIDAGAGAMLRIDVELAQLGGTD
jgi:S1-C subfamily serine protease